MLVGSAAGAIQHKSGGVFVSANAVQYQSSSAFANAIPKAYSGTAWYALISYGIEWRLVVGLGQSNMVGNPDPTTTGYGVYPSITVEGAEYKTIAGTVTYPLNEPTGNNDTPFHFAGQDTSEWNGEGSIWPSLVKTYYDTTGTKVIALSLGVNGSASSAWVSSYCAAAKIRIDAALSYLDAHEYDYEWEDIVWIQGETDNFNGVTSATYQTNLTTIFNYFINQYPARTLRLQCVYPFGGVWTPPFNVQDAIDTLAIARSDIYLATDVQYEEPGLYHFSQPQLNALGEAIATSISDCEGF